MERIEALELVAKISQSSFSSLSDFITKQGELEEKIIEIRDENRKLNKEFKSTAKDSENLTGNEIAKRKILSRQIAENKNELRGLTTQQRKLTKEIKSGEDGNAVYKKLSDRLSRVKRELKDLAVQGKQAPKALQEEFEKLDGIVRGADEKLGDYQRNVGDYQSAFDGFSGNIKEGFESLVGGLENAEGGLGKVTQGTAGLSRGFKALLANPVVAVFAAIAAALITLFNLFSRSEKGASLLAKGI